MSDWIIGILSPNLSFGIPLVDTHLFQIYAIELCDMMWFSRNQAIHKGLLPEASKFAANIKRLSLDHYATWQSISQPVRELWSPPKAGSFSISTLLLETFSQYKLQSVEMQKEPSSRAGINFVLLMIPPMVKLKQPSWLILWLPL